MNVLKRCYQELFGQHGPALFDLPDVSKAPHCVSQALQHCCDVNTLTSVNRMGMVRGRRPCRIPGDTFTFVPAMCSDEYSNGAVLFEPPESGLPAGLLASPAVVQVNKGTAYVPVVNVDVTDVMLYPCSMIGVTEVPPVVAVVSAQNAEVGSTIQEQMRHRFGTVFGEFPHRSMKWIDESLDSLSGTCWFPTLDLASGYNQVAVTERDRFKTAFCTTFGLFEWNCMPFAQHVERLEMVLGRLQWEGLKGVSTDPTKIEAVAGWQRPNNEGELRSFLGFASYYRHFVEGFAKLAGPLHKLVVECAGSGPRKRSNLGLSEA
ncbi:Retrovirus-related Pol polyprotein from transposon opus [Labeo rohita]|uniref:Retrovirus-related Pol polyprotein from transposon opus n=1 Tax=Labeo rohita TaxID=84645 RepID=A0ABQ8L6M1_LABRO|nr:Retrovirus-related Pol polyprotein from transposon opus [Labeo rohita]